MGKSLAEKEQQKDRESRLQLAIANDDVDELHNLLVEERELLDRVSKHPFPNTPLHIAAAAGKTKVAMEMAILKPSFARKLNPEGYSPMHLALQHAQYHTVKALMTANPKLIRVQGRDGITPLHFVAGEKGDNQQESKELLELLAEFLFACKLSIEDLTCQRETAVHVAIKNHNLKAFEVLFGWLKRVHMMEIMYSKDQDDNTVLDIIASIVPQLEQKLEQLEISVLCRITNKEDVKEEAREFFQNLAELLGLRGRGRAKRKAPLSKLLSMELTAFEKFRFWWGHHAESARNIILLVATLITTATYQAALSPPGGYWQDNSSKPAANSTDVTASSSSIKQHQAGNIILSGSKLYLFTALNSSVFLVSIGAILFTAISLLPRSIAVFLLMWLLGISYYTTAAMGFPKSERVGANLTEGIYLSLQVFVFLVPLMLCMSYYNFRLRIEATGRRVDNFLEWTDRK